MKLTMDEIMELLQLNDRKHFRSTYLRPAIEAGWVAMLYPDKPRHPGQRYCLTEAGLQLLTELTEK